MPNLAQTVKQYIAPTVSAGGPGSGWFTENGHVGHGRPNQNVGRRGILKSPQVMKPKHQEGLAQRGFKFIGNIPRNGSQPTVAKTGQDIYQHKNGWQVAVKHEGGGKFRYQLINPAHVAVAKGPGFGKLMERYDKANPNKGRSSDLTVKDQVLNPKNPKEPAAENSQQLANPRAPEKVDEQAPGPKWLDSLKKTYLQTVGAKYEPGRSSEHLKLARYDMGFGVEVSIQKLSTGEDSIVVSQGIRVAYRGSNFTEGFKQAQLTRNSMMGQDGSPVGPVKPAARVDEKALASTPIVSSEKLGNTASSPTLKTLADGTKMVFKKDSQEPAGVRVNISPGQQAIREVAAYKISQIVGDKMVPTTVFRTDENGAKGVAQLFASGNTVALEVDKDKRYGNWSTQQRAAAFDYVIGNTDRHAGNWLVDNNGNVTLIDHGLTFPSRPVGYFRSGFIDRLSQDKQSVSTQVADNYVAHKQEILKTLKDLKLPEEDILATGNRIDNLRNRMGRWYDSYGMHAAKVEK